MFGNQITAAIRTAAAAAGTFVVLMLVESFADVGIVLDLGPDFAGALSLALFAVMTGIYNIAVNFLAERVWPGFGYLLLVNKAPEYDGR